jgi:hypothetical protein
MRSSNESRNIALYVVYAVAVFAFLVPRASEAGAGPRIVNGLTTHAFPYPVVAGDEPVQAIVVLGGQGDGAAGACGESAFEPAECVFKKGGETLGCKR